MGLKCARCNMLLNSSIYIKYYISLFQFGKFRSAELIHPIQSHATELHHVMEISLPCHILSVAQINMKAKN